MEWVTLIDCVMGPKLSWIRRALDAHKIPFRVNGKLGEVIVEVQDFMAEQAGRCIGPLAMYGNRAPVFESESPRAWWMADFDTIPPSVATLAGAIGALANKIRRSLGGEVICSACASIEGKDTLGARIHSENCNPGVQDTCLELAGTEVFFLTLASVLDVDKDEAIVRAKRLFRVLQAVVQETDLQASKALIDRATQKAVEQVMKNPRGGAQVDVRVRAPVSSEWPMLLAFFAATQNLINNGGSKLLLVLGPQKEEMTIIAMSDQARAITGLDKAGQGSN